MSSAFTSSDLNQTSIPAPPALDPFDTRAYFERWLAEVNPAMLPFASESTQVESENSGIFIGSYPGSNCEVSFEGVLHFDGYSMGNITSPDGTLVLTKRGRIEADISVGVAVIGGCVTGDITASDRVILESEARVNGQIRTPALSVRLGAVFDGDCLFTAPRIIPQPSQEIAPERSRRFGRKAIGVGA
jgi:cytoskeletal protein CcmA (bactofilin family)